MWKCLHLEQGGARRHGGTQPGSKQAQEDVGDRTPHLPSPHHSFPNTSAGARDPSLKRRSQPDSEGLDGLSACRWPPRPAADLLCEGDIFSEVAFHPWGTARRGSGAQPLQPCLLEQGGGPTASLHPSLPLPGCRPPASEGGRPPRIWWWTLGACKVTFLAIAESHTRGGQGHRVRWGQEHF